MHLPTAGIQKSLYLMKIMQESIKLVCGLWSLIILGIIENLRKIKASRVVLLPGAPDRASIILILQQS